MSQDWRQRAERERRDKFEHQRRDALRRLRRIEAAARARFAFDGPAARDPRPVIFDSERYAAPLAERLGPRERVQIVLWGTMTIVGFIALVSFFSAPLMDADVALSALAVATMLILSYLM